MHRKTNETPFVNYIIAGALGAIAILLVIVVVGALEMNSIMASMMGGSAMMAGMMGGSANVSSGMMVGMASMMGGSGNVSSGIMG